MGKALSEPGLQAADREQRKDCARAEKYKGADIWH
jgi:hypothetical protein